MATEMLSAMKIQRWAKCGESDESQYRPLYWVKTETMVQATRMRQYWKMQNQMIWDIC